MLLKNRIAMITGAGSRRGIGRATAELFAEHGATVIALDLDAAGAAETANALAGEGHAGFACDVTHADACAEAATEALRRCGRVDILVNSAGIALPHTVLEVGKADYDAVMDVNLRGTLQMCQAVLPAMKEQRSGAIVNLASVAGQRGGGLFGGTHYAASKAGVMGLTRAIAREMAPFNVRANAVSPSLINTEIALGKMSPEREREVLAAIPMGRVGEAREVAGCILFLASDLASYVTGTTLDVNGGSHIH